MRQNDGGDISPGDPGGMQPERQLPGTQAHVEKQVRPIAFDEAGIPGATAGQDGEKDRHPFHSSKGEIAFWGNSLAPRAVAQVAWAENHHTVKWVRENHRSARFCHAVGMDPKQSR
jgi:hypothetical protein